MNQAIILETLWLCMFGCGQLYVNIMLNSALLCEMDSARAQHAWDTCMSPCPHTHHHADGVEDQDKDDGG
jgi:hypothetical protein